jgi:hypothetical protein
LPCESSAEIDFLFIEADSSAAGNKSGPIGERIREFSDAAIRPGGRFVDVESYLQVCWFPVRVPPCVPYSPGLIVGKQFGANLPLEEVNRLGSSYTTGH